MSAPQTPPVDAAPKAKSKTLLYVLLGCGGCIALAGITGIVLLVFGSVAAKRSISAGQNMSSTMKIAVQEETLSLYLQGDTDRLGRMTKAWGELAKEAGAGELKLDDLEALQKSIDTATSDDKLSGDEADAILAQGEKLAK